MKGKLIAIEGINGCGKSTIIKEIASYYTRIGEMVKIFKFPERTGKYGSIIDDHLHKKNVFNSTYDLLDAFAANRLDVKDEIISYIQLGYIVICDRYFFSGIAYHIPLNASKSKIKVYNDIIGHFDNGMPLPDMTYLINGNFLKLRNEQSQRYHYEFYKAHQLFDIFREVISLNTKKYTLLRNEFNKSDMLSTYIINDINVNNWNNDAENIYTCIDTISDTI